MKKNNNIKKINATYPIQTKRLNINKMVYE